MKCRDYKPLLMGLIDGELDEEQRDKIESHLSFCSQCRREINEFRNLEEVAEQMNFIQPEEAAWEAYWAGIYNRIERKLAWILVSLGTILLLGYGGYKLLEGMLFDSSIPVMVRVGVSALILGFIVLSISIVRERMTLIKTDKYTEVQQ